VQLGRAGHAGLAAAYVVVSVVGGVLAVVLGLLAGRAAVRAVDSVDDDLRAGEGAT
jgi:CrcB protein